MKVVITMRDGVVQNVFTETADCKVLVVDLDVSDPPNGETINTSIGVAAIDTMVETLPTPCKGLVDRVYADIGKWVSSDDSPPARAIANALGINKVEADAATLVMAVEEGTPMSDAEYKAHGGNQCPCCKSNDIEGREINVDSGTASQEVVCNACGASWNDIYRLEGYGELEES